MTRKIKIFEEYIKRNIFEYGDYIVCDVRYHRTDGKNYLSIIRIHGTPGPKGHPIDYYSAYVLYKYDNNKLEQLKWDHPMTKDMVGFNKEQLESDALYSSKNIEESIYFIKIAADSKKYNL